MQFKKALLRVLAAIILLALLLPPNASNNSVKVNLVHPLKPRDFLRTSAMVFFSSGGGSGVVVRSSQEGSDILTNNHVCIHAAEGGEKVRVRDKFYNVISIKPWSKHDLCMIRIRENLGTSVEVAEEPPLFGDEVTVAGFPLLMPLIVGKGHVSGSYMRRIEPATVVSALVQEGSSGSGVFNSKGQLVMVVFAIKEESIPIGYGYAVPYPFVKQFVEVDSKVLPWVGVPVARF